MKKLIIVLTLIISLVPNGIYALSTTASSAILMDMDSGRILYSKNIHEPRLVASITNIMTT